jgi:hypothetical protein
MKVIEPLLGAGLILLVLTDVFLTVLYARADTGLISRKLANAVFAVFRSLSKREELTGGRLLSFAGPTILVLLVLVWFFGLALGAALIIHPQLGSAILATSGDTPRDFTTALYVGGNSVSIIGGSNYGPQTGMMRMYLLFNSIIGPSVISLTLTYLLQVYNALQRRNALGLHFHLLSRETDDAAELLAGLGPGGEFREGHSTISELATRMSEIKEAHHFYPVLFYFRFRQPFYSVSSSAFTALDLVSLLKSGLSDEKYHWLKESAAVAQLWSASLLTLRLLEKAFVQENFANRTSSELAWRERYAKAVQRLQAAGISTGKDERAGAERYVASRREWDADVQTLSRTMRLNLRSVDPAPART